MLNGIFVFVVLSSVLLAAQAGKMQALTDAIVSDSGKAVTLALGLVGIMAFFLGLMRVIEEAGLLRHISRVVSPALHRLFPSVPPGHPAMSAMILNISSNMLGLANAATPFGIKAMDELDKLNSRKGTATNAMVLFLAINTSGLALLPTSVIALRAALGSHDPAGIFLTTWFASGCATLVGVMAAVGLSRLPRYRETEPPPLPDGPAGPDLEEPRIRPTGAVSRWRQLAHAGFWVLLAGLLLRHLWMALDSQPPGSLVRAVLSYWVLPLLVAALVLFGWTRGVRVYDCLVEGAREGFQVALRIIPYLVAILVAVGMLRASGGIDLLVRFIGPLTAWIRLPAEALPMALLRPLTGSGAYAVMADVMTTHGPDSFIGYLVSTFQGSTETTFYVLAVYFGAVGVKVTRHTLPACLMADAAGLLGAVLIVNLIYG